MKTRSLRVRLLAAAAAAIFAALALAWVALSYLFEGHIERSIQANLIQHGRDLVAGLARDPAGALIVDPAPFDPRFDRPSSGLYWQVQQGQTVLRSRSLWDETIRASAPAAATDWTMSDAAGPFGQKLVLVARQITLREGEAPMLVALGADHAAVTAARTTFSRDLALFLFVLWGALALAAWLQVRLGLKPMDDVRAALANMQGRPDARLAQDAYPQEAAPLAQAINDLADVRQRDLDHAKRRAADLAHSLRTPLAAMAAQSRRAREQGATDAADGMDRAIDAARAAIEHELARARIAAERENARVEAASVVEKLIAVVERTDRGARLDISSELEGVIAPVSEAVLMEIVGPLLENAVKYARTRVRVCGAQSALWVEDDGLGMTEEEMAQARTRGRRLDQRQQGYGLGLSIAEQAAELSGGELLLSRSAFGGLRAEITWAENHGAPV